MNKVSQETMMFQPVLDNKNVAKTIKEVSEALKAKGYNPIDQLAGYLLSGDPTYITSYNNARTNLRQFERYELLEELVREYLKADK